jgi:hypothetical protein
VFQVSLAANQGRYDTIWFCAPSYAQRTTEAAIHWLLPIYATNIVNGCGEEPTASVLLVKKTLVSRRDTVNGTFVPQQS